VSEGEHRAGRPALSEATAPLVLEAARYLGETLDPERVFDRFEELLGRAVQHDGVVVSAYDEREGLIRCEYALVDGAKLDPGTFPPLRLNPKGEGMQSRVIRSGESLIVNDVADVVTTHSGTYYTVSGEGEFRKLPESGPPPTKAALMVPIRHEGRVVGVVQVMSDRQPYSETDLELVEALVGVLAASVRNARLFRATEAEIAARKEAEAAEATALAVATEREQAARVLDAVGEGIFLVDREGVVRLWNRAAELLVGLAAAEICDEPVDERFPSWDAVAAQVAVADPGARPRSVTVPVELRGGESWLSFVAVRSQEGIVYAFRDQTSEQRLEEAKREFVSIVAHELRTPLTAVLGAAQTLLHRDLSPEESRALLEMIASEGERFAHITDQLLVASRLDRGDLVVEQEPVDVVRVARETVEAMRPALPDGVTLELESGDGSVTASADEDRTRQILVNLIDNAVKYSPDGGPIAVRVAREHGTVKLVVSDQGLGIPAAEQPRIFEKFYRADPNLARSPGGTGLGLYISRELAARMHGRIAVQSSPGCGSRFTVELPAG
jgi:PAS domain S-box-containing protein